jgi:hypothetical protein
MVYSVFKQLIDAVYNEISPVSDNHSSRQYFIRKLLSVTCVIAFACGDTLTNLPKKNMRPELPL